MKNSRNKHGFSFYYRTGTILAFMLILHGCSGVTKTAPPVTEMTTETFEVVSKSIENPETGVHELQVVSKTETKVQESSNKPSEQHSSSDSTDYLLISTACLLLLLILYQAN